MDGLFKAALTAALVALLLLAARWWGQRVAGLVVGLPTVTAPALGWLAVSRGPAFAAEAAAGAIAAGAPCALFGLAYALVSRRAGPLVALGAGTLAASSLLPLLVHWQPAAGLLVLPSIVASLACAMALRSGRVAASARQTAPACAARLQIGLTAAVSGAVSGAVTVFAGELGPFASGVLAGAPLVAAAVVVRLHLAGGSGAVVPFVNGYLGGLIARTCFVAMFALLVIPAGALPALLCALMMLALGLRLCTRR